MIDSKETLSEKLIKRGAWLYFFSFLTGPIGYIVKIVLSHDLTVSQIGILYGVISLVSLLSIYHDFGFTEALNYFLPKYIVEKDYSRLKSVVAYAAMIQVPTSLLIGGALYHWSDFIAGSYFHSPETAPVLRIFSLFFIGLNLFMIVNTIFGASQDTKSQKGTEFVRMLSILAITYAFHLSGHGSLIYYAWNWIFGLFMGILFSYVLFYKKLYRVYLRGVKVVFEKELFMKVFRYALWVLLAINVGTVLSNVDMQLIVYMLGTESAGYYSNYLSIIGIPFIVVTPIISFLFPVISELHSKGDEDKIASIKSIFYKYFGVMGIIISGFMFVYAKEFATILFGAKFALSGEILQYSIFFLVFNFLLQINFQILAGVGRIQERVKILSVGLAFNVVLNVILIRLLGVHGSSLAVGLSWIPLFYLGNRATRMYDVCFDFRFLLKNIFATIFLSAAFLVLKSILPIPPERIQALIYILIIGFLYIMAFASFNQTEWKLFFHELKRLRKQKSV